MLECPSSLDTSPIGMSPNRVRRSVSLSKSSSALSVRDRCVDWGICDQAEDDSETKPNTILGRKANEIEAHHTPFWNLGELFDSDNTNPSGVFLSLNTMRVGLTFRYPRKVLSYESAVRMVGLEPV